MTVITNAINNKIGGSNSGVTNTLTIDNASNTASSQAQCLLSVGGATSGDPYITHTVAGATSWSSGVDNSASDAYVISASTALGTTNVVSMATGGAVSFVLGNVDITKSSNGTDVSETVSNTSNTASSTASHYSIVAGSTAGDAVYQSSVSGVTQWTWGIDNSVTSPTADPFVISQGTALGTNNIMSVATSGEINYPLQPAFLAYLSSTALNKTGNGASYQLGTDALTEVFDQNSDFNTNGTFTAPVTGRYQLSGAAFLTGNTILQIIQLTLITSNRSYVIQVGRSANGTDIGTNMSLLVDMDAADTATFSVAGFGEAANSDDVNGTTAFGTYFSGYLAC